VEGTVINARVFSRKGIQKDDRSGRFEDEEVTRLRKTSRTRSASSARARRGRCFACWREDDQRPSHDDARKVLLNKGV